MTYLLGHPVSIVGDDFTNRYIPWVEALWPIICIIPLRHTGNIIHGMENMSVSIWYSFLGDYIDE